MRKTRYWAFAFALALAALPAALSAAAPRCYPTNRFVVLQGGLVRDTLTQLVWQQQVSGLTMNWEEAKTYCQSSGFRLPSIRELVSLVDRTVISGPKIDQVAFPDTPIAVYWTSTPLAGLSGSAWVVYFSNGNSNSSGVENNSRVRCVR